MLEVPGQASVPSPGPTQRQGESRFWTGPYGGQRRELGEGRAAALHLCWLCRRESLAHTPLPLWPWAPGGVILGL